MAEVVSGSPHKVWVPVATDAANTVYVGSIVTQGTDGVICLPVAAGAYDTTGKDGTPATASIPYGVVVGTSRQTESYNSTQKRNQITSIITSNANFTVDMMGIEGGWGLDKQAYVEVALIGPETIIRAPLYASSYGTAPTAKAVASGASSTGMGYTTATHGFTSVDNNTTAYCRSGANMGITRITTNAAHATTFTFTSPFPYAIAVGDTFVHVNVRSHGLSLCDFDATGSWIDTQAALTANYYGINVIRLNLSTAGKEYVDFMFNAFSFLPALA